MKSKVGDAGEKAERDMIDNLGLGSSSFHMGHEEEITFVGQKLKRNTHSLLGNDIRKDDGKFLGKV